ncbi:MAG: hypothetical protein ACXVXC_01820 [Nocardioidaceae bacterium]
MSGLKNNRVVAVATGAGIVVLLGSVGAYAAGQIGSDDIRDNSIRSVDLHDGGVQKPDIGPGAVGGNEILDGSVAEKNLSPGVQEKLNKQGPVSVGSLSGAWSASNSSVKLTPDGVSFGPYANGGGCSGPQDHGSVEFKGLNGQKLSSITNLVYYARYASTGDTGGVGSPYLRVFLDGDQHDAIFSPNTQGPDPDTAEGPFHEWVGTSGTWRYDDDGDSNPAGEESFSKLVADHGDATISGIYVSTGCSAGTNLQALMRWMEINGQTYNFGS